MEGHGERARSSSPFPVLCRRLCGADGALPAPNGHTSACACAVHSDCQSVVYIYALKERAADAARSLKRWLLGILCTAFNSCFCVHKQSSTEKPKPPGAARGEDHEANTHSIYDDEDGSDEGKRGKGEKNQEVDLELSPTAFTPKTSVSERRSVDLIDQDAKSEEERRDRKAGRHFFVQVHGGEKKLTAWRRGRCWCWWCWLWRRMGDECCCCGRCPQS